MQQGPHRIGSTIFLLVQSDAKDQGYGEDWTFTHDLDIAQDLFTQISREYPLDTWCRLMACIAGEWSMVLDCNDDRPLESPGSPSVDRLSPEQHARAQLAAFATTLPALRGEPGGLRLELWYDPPSASDDDSASSDDDADEPPHATLAHSLAALLSLQ
jgi:hypothetical protein